jgi:DNA-directed RNA polymerase alpha subunit
MQTTEIELEEDAKKLICQYQEMIEKLQLQITKLKSEPDVFLNKVQLCTSKELEGLKSKVEKHSELQRNSLSEIWMYVKSMEARLADVFEKIDSKFKENANLYNGALLTKKIKNIKEVSSRARNALIAEGVDTVADLIDKTFKDLLFPNFGKKSREEIVNWLVSHNLRLKEI